MRAYLSRIFTPLAVPAAVALVIAIVAGAAILATTLNRLGYAAAPEVDDFVARKLKAAIMETETKLGTLEPWQKKLLDEEAVPQYQRFVRDYRSAQTHSGTAVTNLSVDIDLDSLKNYLRFYAPKVFGANGELPLLVYMQQGGEDCGEKCVSAAPQLRTLVAARLSRRGMKPVWVSGEDLSTEGIELSPKALSARLAELASVRKAVGAYVVRWGRAPADDTDSAHADEERYQIYTSLELKAIGGTPFKNEGKLDLLANHNFTTSYARLATDLFTELGARVAVVEKSANKGSVDAAQNETRLAIIGYRDFAQLAQLKSELQTRLPDSAVYERKVTRGRATFVISGEGVARSLSKTISELKAAGIVGQAQLEIEQ